MEYLPTAFIGGGEVAGVQFRQLFRFQDLCLYELNGGRRYEIIKARYRKAATTIIAGRKVVFQEKEHYPSGESWGRYEFSVTDLPTAIERYNQQARSMKYEIVLTPQMLTAQTGA